MLETVRERAAPYRLLRDEPEWQVLDEPHAAIWEAVRQLFPRHALVTQTDYGYMMVSWSLEGRRPGSRHMAAPVIIRIRPGLLLALWTCDPEARDAIAREQEATLREALAGYNPHSRVPTCGVIELGD